MIIGIGIDVAETPRIAGLIERHGERFLNRTYTEREIAYCRDRKRASEHYAARWAAKEAVAKAFNTGISKDVHWKDIEVTKADTGAPGIQLYGDAKVLADKIGVTRIHLSLTHTEAFAAAVAILEK